MVNITILREFIKMVGFKSSFDPAGATPEQKKNIVNWAVPDYNKGIEFTSSPQTAEFQGFCTFSNAGGQVNGKTIKGFSAPVKSGDVINFSGSIILYAMSYQTWLPEYYHMNVGAPYTATESGWLNIRLNRPDAWGTAYAYIDGTQVFSYYGRATTSGYTKVKIEAGQTYTTTGVYSNPIDSTIFYNYDF